MGKISDDYLKKTEVRVRVCDSPEEIAETEEMNKKMREVERDYRHRAALSWQKARGLVLRNSRVRS